MSRRSQIAFSPEEVAAFVDEQQTITLATNGHDGWPHLMPLWYIVRGEELWAWTYAKSQKVKNIERDSKCTLQIEEGTEYTELRGVMFKCEAIIHRDLETVAQVGADLAARYTDGLSGGISDAMRAQAAKRVAFQFKVVKTASWDHRKLGGTY